VGAVQIAANAQADENALEAQHTGALPGLVDTTEAARIALGEILPKDRSSRRHAAPIGTACQSDYDRICRV
jgi:hypothetical protein